MEGIFSASKEYLRPGAMWDYSMVLFLVDTEEEGSNS